MIVRIKNGVANIPIIDIGIFIAVGLVTILDRVRFHSNMEFWFSSLGAVVAMLLILHFVLFLRWCTVKNGTISCHSLFWRSDINQADSRITFAKDGWCTFAYYLWILNIIFSRSRSGGLLNPRWIVLEGSGQTFKLTMSTHVRERDQSLQDILSGLGVKVQNIDVIEIASTAERYRRRTYWGYFFLVCISASILVYLVYVTQWSEVVIPLPFLRDWALRQSF